ncbi:hypothetical protein QBC32DRAFT_61560 [Pseudoneurospora amorphoporcata]|uniref:Uncharacterized protein n=1 Tax=Pseudoneurospora amorphoporcata TaxID=241081 RepID=A0AAN6NZY9_9PEZI|nr:hypothetical protein QBC32DRAFT_61560 [Pseudoneurospora amorphoporcata]
MLGQILGTLPWCFLSFFFFPFLFFITTSVAFQTCGFVSFFPYLAFISQSHHSSHYHPHIITLSNFHGKFQGVIHSQCVAISHHEFFLTCSSGRSFPRPGQGRGITGSRPILYGILFHCVKTQTRRRIRKEISSIITLTPPWLRRSVQSLFGCGKTALRT